MSDDDNLYYQLIEQRDRKYTLYHAYSLKTKKEKDHIAKVIHRKLRDSSSLPDPYLP